MAIARPHVYIIGKHAVLADSNEHIISGYSQVRILERRIVANPYKSARIFHPQRATALKPDSGTQRDCMGAPDHVERNIAQNTARTNVDLVALTL
jgi:hypothetical protein